VIVAPNAEDSQHDSLFGGTAVHAFQVAANNVTIASLTIDGEANPALTAGKNNFRTGVLINGATGTFNSLTVDSLDVKNIFRRGVQVSSVGAKSAGHQITNNLIDGVDAPNTGSGIAVFEADALVS